MFTLLILATPVSALFLPILLFAPPCQASWFMPPAVPVPLPLAQWVEGAGNPLCPVPHAPRMFPFPWHEEGCPGPPLSLWFTPPATPSPLISHQRGESGGIPPPPHPPHSLPRPMCTSPFVCENRTQRGSAQGEGPGTSGGPTTTTRGGGEHHHRRGSSAARNPGWGGAREWKGGGAEKGSGGGGEP